MVTFKDGDRFGEVLDGPDFDLEAPFEGVDGTFQKLIIFLFYPLQFLNPNVDIVVGRGSWSTKGNPNLFGRVMTFLVKFMNFLIAAYIWISTIQILTNIIRSLIQMTKNQILKIQAAKQQNNAVKDKKDHSSQILSSLVSLANWSADQLYDLIENASVYSKTSRRKTKRGARVPRGGTRFIETNSLDLDVIEQSLERLDPIFLHINLEKAKLHYMNEFEGLKAELTVSSLNTVDKNSVVLEKSSRRIGRIDKIIGPLMSNSAVCYAVVGLIFATSSVNTSATSSARRRIYEDTATAIERINVPTSNYNEVSLNSDANGVRIIHLPGSDTVVGGGNTGMDKSSSKERESLLNNLLGRTNKKKTEKQQNQKKTAKQQAKKRSKKQQFTREADAKNASVKRTHAENIRVPLSKRTNTIAGLAPLPQEEFENSTVIIIDKTDQDSENSKITPLNVLKYGVRVGWKSGPWGTRFK